MQRLFAAIPVVPESPLLELMTRAGMIFRHEGVRWVSPTQLHLTLKFFGETPQQMIPEIEALFSSKVFGFRAFQFQIRGVGIFGSRYQPRVIWAGTHDEGILHSLGESLLDAAAQVGFPRDRLPFVPHLTLARIHHLGDKKRLQEWLAIHRHTPLQVVEAREVILYESILTPTGAIYREAARFPLAEQLRSAP